MSNNSNNPTGKQLLAALGGRGGERASHAPPSNDRMVITQPEVVISDLNPSERNCSCFSVSACDPAMRAATEEPRFVMPSYFDGGSSIGACGIVVLGSPAKTLVTDQPGFWAELTAQWMQRYGTPSSTQILATQTQGLIRAPDATDIYRIPGILLTHSVNQNGSMADFALDISGQRAGGQTFGPQRWLYTSPGPNESGRLLILFQATENSEQVPTNLQTSDAAYTDGGRLNAVAAVNIQIDYTVALPAGHTVSLRAITPRDPNAQQLFKLARAAARR